jgi:hypothetical protein
MTIELGAKYQLLVFCQLHLSLMVISGRMARDGSLLLVTPPAASISAGELYGKISKELEADCLLLHQLHLSLLESSDKWLKLVADC